MGSLIVSPKKKRRNLFNNSQDIALPAWNVLSMVIEANAYTAPDGTLTADSYIKNVGSNTTSPFRSLTVSSGTYTFSIYAKKGVLDTWCELTWVGTTTVRNLFDLTNGVIGSGANHGIQSVGDGWYRCFVTHTEPNTRLVHIYYAGRTDNNPGANSTADGVSTALILWGAQLESSSVITPYQRILNNKIERNPNA